MSVHDYSRTSIIRTLIIQISRFNSWTCFSDLSFWWILIISHILWSAAKLFFFQIVWWNSGATWNFALLQNTNLYAFHAHTHHIITNAFHTISSFSMVWRRWASFCIKTTLSCPQNIRDPFCLKDKQSIILQLEKGTILWTEYVSASSRSYPQKQE